MRKPVQQRTLQTRARIVAAAQQLVAESGHEALRIDDLVERAGVGKGTFFAHFGDKDGLMDWLVGQELSELMDAAQARRPPVTVEQLVERLQPLLAFAASERCVFDIILRRSGAAAVEEIGAIATALDRLVHLVAGWIAAGGFRQDAPVAVLAEGVQAFAMQALALNFCALNNGVSVRQRLLSYLRPWLQAPVAGAGAAAARARHAHRAAEEGA
ncbi:TetR/AcrR family transcriptional regulator [Ideonella sp.]|uniref:TetR/AcrR family transcriptional regulator n=1 Tax=Ideonella sp. TaxID=1929293 RepID=UPI0035B3B256